MSVEAVGNLSNVDLTDHFLLPNVYVLQLGGHSLTTLTRFWLILTTYPPTLDFFYYLPPYVDIFYLIRFYKKRHFWDHLPTSSCQRS
jgi:hypothetical protein